MKHIIFIRHGKAEEKWPRIDDWSRKLTEKGEEKTREYIQAVKDKIKHVDAIISSWSRRTKQTAEIIAQELGIARHAIQYHSALWTRESGDKKALLGMIHSFPASWKSVILVGHNDELSEVAMSLTNAPLDYLPKSGSIGLWFSAHDRALIDKENNAEVWQYLGD